MLLLFKISFYFVIAIVAIAIIHSLFFPPDKEAVARMEAKRPVEEPPLLISFGPLQDESIKRNPARHRISRCTICGARSPEPDDCPYNMLGRDLCGMCRREVFQAVSLRCKSASSKEEREIEWAREVLMRMIALDFSDGVISGLQAEKDYECIDKIYKQKLNFLHTSEEYYRHQKYREQMEMIENQQKIKESMDRINHNMNNP